MLSAIYTSQFKKDYEKMKKRELTMKKLTSVMLLLESEFELEPKYKNHFLKGKYNGCSECHIQPDWLLIYQILDKNIFFIRTGSHSDLF